MFKDRRASRPWGPRGGRGADSKRPLPPPLARQNPGIPKARSKLISSFVHPALTLRRKGGPQLPAACPPRWS